MPDRFDRGRAVLDSIEAPDLWDEARRASDVGDPALPPRRRSGRALAVAALAVVAAVAGYAVLTREDGHRVTTTPDTTTSVQLTAPCRPGGAFGLLGTTTPPDGFDAVSSDTHPATGRPPGGPPHAASYFDGPGDGVIDVFDGPLPRPASMSSVPTPIGPALVGTSGERTVAEVELDVFGFDCTIGFRGDAVGIDVLTQLLGGLYLADGAGRPLLRPHGAVWPETGPLLAGPDQPAWRSDQRETAEEFARQVLGWEDAIAPIEDSEPSEDGEFGGVFGVSRTGGPGHVQLRVVPTLGGRWYGVVAVDLCCATPDEAENPDFGSVQVLLAEQTGRALAGPAPDGAVSHGVRFDHSGRLATAEFAMLDASAAIDLGYSPDTTGSVLVLFRDAAGDVRSAWGRPLPAGDFAAG